jgi:hypothetical protein
VKTIKIGVMKYPIVSVESTEALDPAAVAVQCVAGQKSGVCAHVYEGEQLFRAWGNSSKEAAKIVAAKIARAAEDSKITSVDIVGEEIPVRSRNVLWDHATQSEGFAPMDVVHWWIKGCDGEEDYKCDIHFTDGASFEGIGKTLKEALSDLVAICTE